MLKRQNVYQTTTHKRGSAQLSMAGAPMSVKTGFSLSVAVPVVSMCLWQSSEERVYL